MPENGWSEHQLLVLSKLDDLKKEQQRQERRREEDQRELNTVIGNIRTDIATLQVKAGVWGGIAGLIPFGLYLATKALGAH